MPFEYFQADNMMVFPVRLPLGATQFAPNRTRCDPPFEKVGDYTMVALLPYTSYKRGKNGYSIEYQPCRAICSDIDHPEDRIEYLRPCFSMLQAPGTRSRFSVYLKRIIL